MDSLSPSLSSFSCFAININDVELALVAIVVAVVVVVKKVSKSRLQLRDHRLSVCICMLTETGIPCFSNNIMYLMKSLKARATSVCGEQEEATPQDEL